MFQQRNFISLNDGGKIRLFSDGIEKVAERGIFKNGTFEHQKKALQMTALFNAFAHTPKITRLGGHFVKRTFKNADRKARIVA